MSTRTISIICLLYLLLPCLIFLAGWVQPVVAWPVGLGLVAAVLWVAQQCPARPLRWSGTGALRVMLLLLLGALWVHTTGPWGLVAQSGDATVRNAIYAALVRDAWPLTVAGEPFVYYLGFWLPPALAAKLGAPAEAAQLVWMLAGVWLALLAAACGYGTRRALVFALILFLMGDVVNWANRVYYKLCDGELQEWALFLDLHFTPSCVQLRNTYNHYIAPLMLMGMLAGRLLPARTGLLAGAMVLICSPLAAVALLPLLILRGGRQLLHPLSLVAALYAALPLLFLAGGAGGQLALIRPAGECSLASLSPLQLALRYALQLAAVLGPAVIILRRWRRTSWFISAAACTLILPLVWIGMWNNEFIYKGAAVLWFCLAWLYAAAWCRTQGTRKAFLALFVLLSASDSYGQLIGALKSLSCDSAARRQNIRAEWNGSLDQEGDSRARQFDGRPLCHYLFKF